MTLHRAALHATRPKGVSQGLDTGGDRRPSLSKGKQHSSSPSVRKKRLVLSRLTGCLLHNFFFQILKEIKGLTDSLHREGNPVKETQVIIWGPNSM